MNAPLTSLSAGLVIHRILSEADLPVTDIFPVYTPKAVLPYVYYQRTDLSNQPVKGNLRGSESVTIELNVCAETYPESIALAESVRDTLDGESREVEGLAMRWCKLSGASEGFNGDAYFQTLIFTLKLD